MSTSRKWPIEHPEQIQLYSLATPNGQKVSIAPMSWSGLHVVLTVRPPCVEQRYVLSQTDDPRRGLSAIS